MGDASALISTSVHSLASYSLTARRSQVGRVGKSRVLVSEWLPFLIRFCLLPSDSNPV